MNNETLNPLINRIDVLENRIDTTEDQNRKKGSWLMDKVYKAGSIIGLLVGIPSAIVGAVTIWDRFTATPEIQRQLGPDLKLSLAQDGHLDLECALILNNIGDDKDIVTVTSAHLISYPLGAGEPFNLEDISVSEKGASIQSIGVKADEIHKVDIISSSKLTNEKQGTFPKTGLYELVLDLNLQKSQQSPKVKYCFWVAEDVVKSLLNNVPKKYDEKDKRCRQLGGE
jgi:hypothetical protein